MTADNYLIQSLMWRQCVSEDIFKTMISKCLNPNADSEPQESETQVNSEMVSQMVSKVNRKLRPFNIEITRGPNESDGTIHYALINTADNEITRMATNWTPKEMLYFKKLLENIIESNTASISSTKMLNIGREEDLKLSISAKENLMNKWLEQKWFEEITDGKIAIGVRTLLEMNTYMREHFEVQDCFRCKILCIRGLNCMTCDTKLHYHCSDAQFIPNNKCPNCSKQFADNRSTSSATVSDQPLTASNGVEEDTDEDTEEETEHNSPPVESRRRPKRSRRS